MEGTLLGKSDIRYVTVWAFHDITERDTHYLAVPGTFVLYDNV